MSGLAILIFLHHDSILLIMSVWSKNKATSILRPEVNDQALINCVSKTTFIIRWQIKYLPQPMYYHPSSVLTTVIYSHLEWLSSSANNIGGKIFLTCELLHKHPLITPHFCVHPVSVPANILFMVMSNYERACIYGFQAIFKIYNIWVWSNVSDLISVGSTYPHLITSHRQNLQIVWPNHQSFLLFKHLALSIIMPRTLNLL